MGLKIMCTNGTPRDMWYARFTRNGAKVNVNLRVPLRGTIPTTTDADGRTVYDVNGRSDEAFEKSREAALSALKKMEAAAKRTGDTEAVKQAKTADLASRYYRAREGKSIRGADTRLDDLPVLWRSLPRDTPATEARMKVYDATFRAFAKFARAFAAEHGGVCETINTITPEMAAAWFNELRATFSWETVKNKVSLLSGAFKRWATNGEQNPFVQVIKRHRGQGRIRRQPLTGDEIARVFECSRNDALYGPLIVCAACTGLRIGDVCHLRWENVDLRGGFVDVVTAKAGVRVTIPIFGALRKVLEAQQAECADNEPFVFPTAAAKYDRPSERSTIIRGVKPFLARAVFGDTPEPEDGVLIGEERPGQTADEVIEIIAGAKFAPGKKARVIDTYRRFAAGDSYADITAATGRHKGQTTQDLQTVEALIGRRIRPGDKYASTRKTTSTTRDLIERTRADREIGKYRASLFGWHSFRTGFVTLATEYGVPLEDVRRIVGHTTLTMTRDYYRPTAKHTAERVRKQMRGTVLETGARVPVGATIDVTPDAANVAVPALPPPEVQTPAKDKRARLAEIESLFADGLIGADERREQRARVLNEI